FGVGLGFLMPVDLTLSCWVFYLIWKIERVLAAMTGWWGLPRFPYAEEQQFGAYACWALLALLPKLKEGVQSLKHGRMQEKEHASSKARSKAGKQSLTEMHMGAGGRVKASVLTENLINQPAIASSQTKWLLGFFVCFLGLTLLCVQQGMSWWLAVLFFAGYFLVAVGITRIRAQLGSPVHDLHFAGPDRMLLFVLGSKNLSVRDLCFLTIFGGFNRAYRGHPMPHMLEGMWLERRLQSVRWETQGARGIEPKVATRASVLGWLLGYGFGVWALLRASFQFGGRPWYGMEVFRQLDTYRYSPTGFGWASLFAILWGSVQTVLLSTFHNRFNFPLHPAGFVVSGSWSMNLFWVSLFVAWLLKASLIRWGGLAMHRQATPFFMGLVIGDYLVGSFWSLWGCWKKKP
ncbi:MAG: DUF6785 family protein, partial [Armatimonadota bacterium]